MGTHFGKDRLTKGFIKGATLHIWFLQVTMRKGMILDKADSRKSVFMKMTSSSFSCVSDLLHSQWSSQI